MVVFDQAQEWAKLGNIVGLRLFQDSVNVVLAFVDALSVYSLPTSLYGVFKELPFVFIYY